MFHLPETNPADALKEVAAWRQTSDSKIWDSHFEHLIFRLNFWHAANVDEKSVGKAEIRRLLIEHVIDHPHAPPRVYSTVRMFVEITQIEHWKLGLMVNGGDPYAGFPEMEQPYMNLRGWRHLAKVWVAEQLAAKMGIPFVPSNKIIASIREDMENEWIGICLMRG